MLQLQNFLVSNNIVTFFKKNWKNIALGILIILLIFSDFQRRNQFSSQRATIDSLTLANQETKQLLNKKDQVISQQKIILVEKNTELTKMTDSIFALKRKDDKRIKEVKAYYAERWKYSIDSVMIVYTEKEEMGNPIPIPNASDCETELVNLVNAVNTSYIKVPKTVTKDSAGLSLDLSILKQGLRINKILVSDTQSIRVVEQKNGWFKPKTLEVQTVHSNPNIQTIGQTSILYKPKPKRNIVVKVLLFAAGVYLGAKL